jgi:hypothetical protein
VEKNFAFEDFLQFEPNNATARNNLEFLREEGHKRVHKGKGGQKAGHIAMRA